MLPYAQKLPSGAWRYRRPVTDRLKPIVAKDNLVKKLGKTYAEALAEYPKVHADFERTLRKAEEILMAETEPEDLPILTKLELYLEGITKVRRMGLPVTPWWATTAPAI
jgi:hypothetical protein